MVSKLRKAYKQNDRAVMEAYGFSVKEMTESKCVAELTKMYKSRLFHEILQKCNIKDKISSEIVYNYLEVII